MIKFTRKNSKGCILDCKVVIYNRTKGDSLTNKKRERGERERSGSDFPGKKRCRAEHDAMRHVDTESDHMSANEKTGISRNILGRHSSE